MEEIGILGKAIWLVINSGSLVFFTILVEIPILKLVDYISGVNRPLSTAIYLIINTVWAAVISLILTVLWYISTGDWATGLAWGIVLGAMANWVGLHIALKIYKPKKH